MPARKSKHWSRRPKNSRMGFLREQSMPATDQQDIELKVLELVREMVKFDDELRQKYQVGTKFRFVQDRLHALLAHLEKKLSDKKEVVAKASVQAEADETIVYVHLYNVQGSNIRSWQSLLLPKVFYEYSVNRPIYTEKKYIDTLLNSKSNKLQHAFLTIVIKQNSVFPSEESGMKDSLGQPLVRVREGSLFFNKLVSFTHNDQEYEVNEDGQLIKKG